jgi:hypothetical protein
MGKLPFYYAGRGNLAQPGTATRMLADRAFAASAVNLGSVTSSPPEGGAEIPAFRSDPWMCHAGA